MTTLTTSKRSVEDMIECLRTKMDYDEFCDLAPHLRVKLQNGYYGQFSEAEKSNNPVMSILKVVDTAFDGITRKIESRPLVESFWDAEELFATLLWKCGEADARGDTISTFYHACYMVLMEKWRNEVLYADSMREAFALDFDEEAWAKNIDGRVYWEQKIREIATQLAKEEV